MPLTQAQTVAFFEENAQMGLTNATVLKLQEEGINSVDDLADFDKETFEQIAANLRRPSGRIPDPNPNADPGSTVPTPPFVFGAKSQQRLLVASKLVKYYTIVGRTITASNLQWNNVMRSFSEQWKALEGKKDDDEPEVPKISKTLPIIKWTESFKDYTNRVIGVRNIPLAYVIRSNDIVPPIGTIAQGFPHSIEHGSIESELVARASHTHPLFRDDNSALYYKIEEATRGTTYAASIKPNQRTKNGRGAWLALVNQFAGRDKWEAEIKRNEQLLHTRVWKGQSNFTLERFVAQHRHAYVSMQAAAEHVTYQLPNEHSRVGYLLEGIQCSDATLQAAMASIKQDQGQNGMRNDFESAAANLLPSDPVQKKRTERSKRPSADISDVTVDETADVSSFGTKKGIGKSGVHLRYHGAEDYKKLSREQKDELREWRKTVGKKDKGEKERTGKRTKVERDKAIAAAVDKKVDEKIKAMEKDKTDDAESEAYIMSLFKKYHSKVTISEVKATSPTTPAPLKSLLRRAKNVKPE